MNILERVLTAINEEQSRLDGIHVSALSYDCLRRAYYKQTIKESFEDLKTLITFWVGRQMHKTPILMNHEVPLKWKATKSATVVGSPDEYEDGVLLEKKTCNRMPRFPNDHHVRQAEYYSVLLEQNDYAVNEAHILYVDVTEKKIKVFPAKLRPYKKIMEEMVEKAQILRDALDANKPPERNIGWLCNYCNYASICFKENGNDQHAGKRS